LLIVTCATLVGSTLLRQEGNEPSRRTLLALDNVLECRGRQRGIWKRLYGSRLRVIRVRIVRWIGISAHDRRSKSLGKDDEGREISESLTYIPQSA
jgi:hypothetical protein